MFEKFTTHYRSPLGALEIVGSERGVSSVLFTDTADMSAAVPPCLANCVRQLQEYFHRERKEFSLALDLQGTDFQKKVWQELLKISFGQTVSYLEIAIAIGDRKSMRAVGSANGRNPLCLIVPCHRVIGTNGSLTGYGGGLWRKEWLLNFEKRTGQASIFEHDHAQTESRYAPR